jgi:hypothetical protein
VIITDITVGTDTRGAVLSGLLRPERGSDAPFRVEFVVRNESPTSLAMRAEPFLACALLPAMARGENIRVEGLVSPRLLESLRTIQAIYHRWDTSLAVVDIEATPSALSSEAPGRGLFFSGGVDSWYSLLKHHQAARRDEPGLTHLVLVFGFDVKLDNPALFDKILTGVETVAKATGLRLLVVETNVRQFSDGIVPWGFYHGGPMGAVGLALSRLVDHCVIASSYAYAELHPWGSHPLLDPLWSSEAVTFAHDGCEAVRSAKVAAIARSGLALSTLRVCWDNEQSEYNCGRCEKCLRTMLALHVASALDRCSTFNVPLTTAAVRRMVLGESSEIFLRDVVQALAGSRDNRKLARAVESALRWRRWRTGAGRLARTCFGERATLDGVRSVVRAGLSRREAIAR